MQTIEIICVGKLKESYWQDACAEYAKRMSAYCKFQVTELAEQRLPQKPSAAQIAAALEQEGKAILRKIPAQAMVIALCIEGKGYSSQQLADCLQQAGNYGRSNVVFLIGSSYGLSKEVKERAEIQLSLSALTFPHQLARVMLYEQLYRAFQMNQNGKYHK